MTIWRSPSVLAFARMGTLALPIITAPIVARELGPAERGLYGACIGLLTLTPVLIAFGVPLAVRRAAAVRGEAEPIRTVYRFGALAMLPAILVALLAILWLLPGLSSAARAVFFLAMASTVLQSVALCLQSILVVRQDFLGVAIVQSSQTILITVGIAIAWVTGHLSIEFLLAAFALGSLGSLIAAVALTRIGIRGPASSPLRLVSEGARYFGSQVAEVGANSIVQILAVTMLGAHAAGILAVSLTIANLPLVLGHTIGIATYTRVATAPSDTQARLTGDIFRSTLIVALFSALTLAIFSPIVILVLFGPEYADSVPTTLLLLVGSVFLVSNYVSSQMLAALGRGWTMTIAQVSGLIVSVGCLALGGWLFHGGAWAPIAGAAAIVVGRVCTGVIALAGSPSVTHENHFRADAGRALRILMRGKME